MNPLNISAGLCDPLARMPGLERLSRPLRAELDGWTFRVRAYRAPQQDPRDQEQRLFADIKALKDVPADELGTALERYLTKDLKALPTDLRAGALALLLLQFEEVPGEQRMALWNVFWNAIEGEKLSVAHVTRLTGKLASKMAFLPPDAAQFAWDKCIEKLIACARSAPGDRELGERLIQAVEQLPARAFGEEKLRSIVKPLCSMGHQLAALALIHVLAQSPLWSGDGLERLAVMVASIFEKPVHIEGLKPADIEGHRVGEQLLARLFPALGERHLRQERMAVILQFAEASGGLHHAALLPVTSVGWKLANARVTRALGDPSTLADLPHMARLLKKKDLPKALRQCALIADPLKRQARLEEFRSDCEAAVLSEIARKWAQGDWALSGPEYQALHKDVESVPPFLITKTPKREVDEGMPALNRKTPRDGK